MISGGSETEVTALHGGVGWRGQRKDDGFIPMGDPYRGNTQTARRVQQSRRCIGLSCVHMRTETDV
jgi:hypothetical protein